MQCNGKCHLAKQIKTRDGEEKPLSFLLKNIEDVTFYIQVISSPTTTFYLKSRNSNHTHYCVIAYMAPTAGIIQPPQ